MNKYLPTGNKKAFLIVGLIVFIIIYSIWKYRQVKYNKENPIFYKQGKDAKKKWIIPRLLMNELVGGYGYTFSFWYYLNDYKYRQFEWKHVLTKGTRLPRQRKSARKAAAPFVSFTPKINNMKLGLDTNKGFEEIILKDIPLKKWTHIVLVANERTVAVYIDGDLSITRDIAGMPIPNHGNLLVTHKGGFDGSISSIRYSSRAITSGEVYFVYKAGWNSKGLESNPFKKLKYLKKSVDWASFNFNKDKKFGLCDAAKNKLKQKTYIQFAGRGCCSGCNIKNLYTRMDEDNESCKDLCKENKNCIAATFKINKNGSSCTLHKHTRGLKMKDMKNFKTDITCQRTKCYSKRFNLGIRTRWANEKWEETVDDLYDLKTLSNKLIKMDVKKERKSLKKWNTDARKVFNKLDTDRNDAINMYEWSGGQIGGKKGSKDDSCPNKRPRL